MNNQSIVNFFFFFFVLLELYHSCDKFKSEITPIELRCIIIFLISCQVHISILNECVIIRENYEEKNNHWQTKITNNIPHEYVVQFHRNII